jgi:hypothetical protein
VCIQAMGSVDCNTNPRLYLNYLPKLVLEPKQFAFVPVCSSISPHYCLQR